MQADSSMSLRLADTWFTTRTAASGVVRAAAARPSAVGSIERVLVPNREPAVCQPRQRRRRPPPPRPENVQRREQRPGAYRRISRGVLDNPHATASSITRRIPSLAILELKASPEDTSLDRVPRHRRPIPRLSAV